MNAEGTLLATASEKVKKYNNNMQYGWQIIKKEMKLLVQVLKKGGGR